MADGDPHLYHFTARVDPKLPYKLKPFAHRSDALPFWRKLRTRFPNQVVACVLMDNHLHLLIETRRPAFTLRKLAIELRAFSRGYNHRYVLKRSPLRWEEITLPLPINSPHTLRTVIRYIHTNPCKAGMISNPWLWEFSTLREWLGAVLPESRWITQSSTDDGTRMNGQLGRVNRTLLGRSWRYYRDQLQQEMEGLDAIVQSATPLERLRIEDLNCDQLKTIVSQLLFVDSTQTERRGQARDLFVQLRLLRDRPVEDSLLNLEQETGVIRNRIRHLRSKTPSTLRQTTEFLASCILASAWPVMPRRGDHRESSSG